MTDLPLKGKEGPLCKGREKGGKEVVSLDVFTAVRELKDLEDLEEMRLGGGQ